jgi:hypothetical protein
MAGRGPQSFQKKLKEQKRKEKQQEKLAKRMERRRRAEVSPEPLTQQQEGESSYNKAGRGSLG